MLSINFKPLPQIKRSATQHAVQTDMPTYKQDQPHQISINPQIHSGYSPICDAYLCPLTVLFSWHMLKIREQIKMSCSITQYSLSNPLSLQYRKQFLTIHSGEQIFQILLTFNKSICGPL